MNITSTNQIINNTTAKTLNSLKKAVQKPENIKCSAAIISAAAAGAVIAAAMVKTPVTVSEVKQKFLEHGFEEKEWGQICKEITPEQNSEFEQKYGSYAPDMKMVYINGIEDKSELEKFTEFINMDKESGRKMLNNRFEKLFETFSILHKSNNLLKEFENRCAENPEALKLITNVINSDIDAEFLNCLYEWKGKSHKGIAREAQRVLRGRETDMDVAEVQAFTENFSKGLRSQELPNVELYRREGYEVLKNVKLENGEVINLGDQLKKAAYFALPKEIQKVKEFVLDHEITAVQPGFMATSIDYDMTKKFRGPQGPDHGYPEVIWKFVPEKGAKGMFIEGLNAQSFASHEREVLVDKNSTIQIKNIDFDKYAGAWVIEASLSN